MYLLAKHKSISFFKKQLIIKPRKMYGFLAMKIMNGIILSLHGKGVSTICNVQVACTSYCHTQRSTHTLSMYG